MLVQLSVLLGQFSFHRNTLFGFTRLCFMRFGDDSIVRVTTVSAVGLSSLLLGLPLCVYRVRVMSSKAREMTNFSPYAYDRDVFNSNVSC